VGSVRSWEEVHRLHDQESKSGREIARMLGMSRNTVSRLLALPEPPRYQRSAGSKLDPYRAVVIALLHRNPGMPATLVHRRLGELGYTGGITAVKSFVATVRRGVGQTGASGDRLPIEPDSEPGMNIISADFDIMMVNRVNERLFKKPMVKLLGKKCYREFERREDVCPHCPGLAALTTGVPHQVESRGIRDDGTKYAVRLTCHPIVAPNGDPVGFVEVEEDITERKRSERLAELVENLQASLAATQDVTGAIRQALNVAFSLEGVDFGSAYVWDRDTAEYRAVVQRGVSPGMGKLLARHAVSADERSGVLDVRRRGLTGVQAVGQGSDPIELVPIVREGVRVGVLFLGSSTYAEFPAATHAAFEALANITGAAVSSLQALQLERETRADVEGLLGSLPLPAWCTDDKGRITLWNRAAERALGWSLGEVNDSPIPREAGESLPGNVVRFSAKTGLPVRARVTVTSAPRALGARRRTLFVAHPFLPPALETSPVARSEPPRPAEGPPVKRKPTRRVLLLESERAQRTRLTRILRDVGCRVRVCGDAEDVVTHHAAALRSGKPYDFVITELLPATGAGGLELASMLHRSDPHARVILTADAQIVGFESHGLSGALRKPYEPEMVQREIMGLLARDTAIE
jgi:PAS domain S-box-containing protein